MTQEQKAKAYDEALERAREYWETDNDNTLDIKAKGTMEYLFPVLKESEAEKIRKELYSILSEHTGQPVERIYADGDRDFWMNSQEALEYVMIDEILTKRK